VLAPRLRRLELSWPRVGGAAPGALGAALVLGAAIGLLPPLYGAALAGVVGLFLLGLVRPLWPLYLLGLAAPLGSVREIRVGPVGLSPTEGLVAAALVAYGLLLLSRREERARLSHWSAPIALFLLIGLLSTGWVASASDAAKELLRWVELGGAFGLVVALVRCERQARTLLAVLMLGGLLEFLLGAVQFLFQIGPPSFQVGRFLRAYGTFGQPNPYGGYLAMVLPLAIAIVWTHGPAALAWLKGGPAGRGRPLRDELRWLLYALVVAGATAGGLAMSLSRGAWLGATVGLLTASRHGWERAPADRARTSGADGS
jgi:hypothetical protein